MGHTRQATGSVCGNGAYQIDDTDSASTDGFTQIHRFQLIPDLKGSCTVLYNSRRQIDPLLEHVRKTGRLNCVSFAQKRDPCMSLFQKIKCTFEPRRNTDPYLANIGVTVSTNPAGLRPQPRATPQSLDPDGPRTLVVRTDANYFKEIDLATLEPIGVAQQQQLHPDLKGPLSCAHAQYDHESGDLYNYNLDFGSVSTYRIFKSSLTTGKTEILAAISEKEVPPAYIHSFFLTEDFVILAVWSSHFESYGIKILWDRNILDSIGQFNPESKVKWLVVDRRHGRGLVATFESPAMFSFHTVNAWQEQRSETSKSVDIYCDLVQYPTLDILHRFYYENLVSTGPGVSKYAEEAERSKTSQSLVRYHLANVPLDPVKEQQPTQAQNAEIILQVHSPSVGELPTINPSYSTKRSRFVYSVVDQGYSSFFDGIAKLDTETLEVTYWRQLRHTPGEPIFVPDNTREGEDAGFLLSVILDGDKGTSYLLCLDAKTMEETGRAECDNPVGFGFHGHHVPH